MNIIHNNTYIYPRKNVEIKNPRVPEELKYRLQPKDTILKKRFSPFKLFCRVALES